MTVYDSGREPIDPVAPEDACPQCGEREHDALVWVDDGDRVECQRCKTVNRPGGVRDARNDATS